MHQISVRALVLTFFALVLIAGGCARMSRVEAVPISGIPPQPEYPTLVEVDNFSGSVRIVVDPAREPGVWTKVRRAGPEAPRRNDERRELVEVEASSEIHEGARVLRVVTRPTPDAQDVAVDVTVRIARSAGTAVRNSGGSVELVRVAGSVHVENGIAGQPGGDVQIRTGQALVGPAFVQTTDGSILYQVGPDSAGTFDLRSEGGRAEFVTRLGRVDQVTATRDRWRGVLNGGSNEVVLQGDRRVRVAVMEDADAYSPDVLENTRASRWMQRMRGE